MTLWELRQNNFATVLMFLRVVVTVIGLDAIFKTVAESLYFAAEKKRNSVRGQLDRR